MTRTTWLQEGPVETPYDRPPRFDAKRPSAQDAAESPGMSEHSFRRCRHRREAEGVGGPGGVGARTVPHPSSCGPGGEAFPRPPT